jgi:hypothetical protein
MKTALVFLLLAQAGFSQRFVDSSEQRKRLLVPKEQTQIHLPECKDGIDLRVKAVIDSQGKVVRVKPDTLGSVSLQVPQIIYNRVLKQAVKLVFLWRYAPVFVGGKPQTIWTRAVVPCMAPK